MVKRGAAEAVQISQEKIDKPIRRVLAIPTFLWLVLAGLCFNFATYACNSFLVPMLQRYFLMPLHDAAVVVREGRVAWTGPDARLPAGAPAVHRRPLTGLSPAVRSARPR